MGTTKLARDGRITSRRGFCVLGVVLAALLLRVTFYTGVFGSDEVTFVDTAARLLNGDWQPSGYIGAVRYGVSGPMALSMLVFGENQFAANLWTLLTSLGEVGLVVYVAYVMWGPVAAWGSGLLIATLPIHVHYAGRIMGDAPLAFFVTLSFVLFWQGLRSGRGLFFLASGLAIGAVFWIKEVAVIYAAAFAVYPLLTREFDFRWLLVVFGAAGMMVANSTFFLMSSGDPWYVFKLMSGAAAKATTVAWVRDDPWFYPFYLFVDIRHTFLLGILALGASILAVRRLLYRNDDRDPILSMQQRSDLLLVSGWALGLLLVFTFFVTSLRPLQLIAKQTNYMLIFVAPLCLLGGYLIAWMEPRLRAVVVLAVCVGGGMLAGLEQQAIRNFVANSKATITFMRSRPDAVAYVPVSVMRVNGLGQLLEDVPSVPAGQLQPLTEFSCETEGPAGWERYVVIDYETADWIGSDVGAEAIESRVSECAQRLTELTPEGFGAGQAILRLLTRVVALVPGSFSDKMRRYAESYLIPRKAVVYRVMPDSE